MDMYEIFSISGDLVLKVCFGALMLAIAWRIVEWK
jgi:hypothetical protein